MKRIIQRSVLNVSSIRNTPTLKTYYRLGKFLFFSLFIVAFIPSCTKESSKGNETKVEILTETRGACPEGPGGGCLNMPQYFNGTFTYEGCTIPYTATYYICPQGIQMDPVVWDMNNLPNTTNCNKLKNKMNSLYLSDPTALNNIIDAINIGMTNAAQAQIFVIVQTLNPSIYQCSNIPVPCEQQQYQYTFTTRTVACSRLCATYREDPEGGGQWDLFFISCSESCCSRSSHFCMRPDGTICYGPVVYSQTGTCPTNGVSCPNGSTPAGTCKARCSS